MANFRKVQPMTNPCNEFHLPALADWFDRRVKQNPRQVARNLGWPEPVPSAAGSGSPWLTAVGAALRSRAGSGAARVASLGSPWGESLEEQEDRSARRRQEDDLRARQMQEEQEEQQLRHAEQIARSNAEFRQRQQTEAERLRRNSESQARYEETAMDWHRRNAEIQSRFQRSSSLIMRGEWTPEW